MPRKRKSPQAEVENMAPSGKKRAPRQPRKAKNALRDTDTNSSITTNNSNNSNNNALNALHASWQMMVNIFDKAQQNEALHDRYCNDLIRIYGTMEHVHFWDQLSLSLKMILSMNELNDFAVIALKLFVRFFARIPCDDPDDMHPILHEVFHFLLDSTSSKSNVRIHIAKFIALLLRGLGTDVIINEDICEKIIGYMGMQLQDTVANVRVQAIETICRFQNPNDEKDSVISLLLFHMDNDPSVQARKAALAATVHNQFTMPTILERMQDIDESVRRTVFVQLAKYSARRLTISQRLNILEFGCNDRSESVVKIVHSVLLPEWLHCYNGQYVALINAMKIDANYEEIQKFAKVAKQVMMALFKYDSIDNLLTQLPISKTDELAYCVPIEHLTVDVIIYWHSVIEYIQQIDNNAEDEEDERFYEAICELSTFITYLYKYVDHYLEICSNDPDSWEAEEGRFKLLLLIETLKLFDLGDEVGRNNLKQFVSRLLSHVLLDSDTIHRLVQCVENAIGDVGKRMQYFGDLIQSIIKSDAPIDVCDATVSKFIDEIKDDRVKYKVNEVKLRILDLQERDPESDNYDAEKITHELNTCHNLLANMLKNHSESAARLSDAQDSSVASLLNPKQLSKEWIKQGLEIFRHMLCSTKTSRMTPNLGEIYDTFIQRHMRSSCMVVRNQALHCGIVCGMLNERLASEMSIKLYEQIIHHQCVPVWKTAIDGMFELADLYGMHIVSLEEAEPVEEPEQNHLVTIMMEMWNNCDHESIIASIVTGFGRLILSGRIDDNDIVVKLLMTLYDQSITPQINQILGVFVATLIERGKQSCLQDALLPTILAILEGYDEEPDRFESPASVIQFVVNTTRQNNNKKEMHTAIARTFLNHMLEHVDEKNVLKLLADHLSILEVDANHNVRNELKEIAQRILEEPIQNKVIEGKVRKFIAGVLNVRGDKTPIRNGTISPPDVDEASASE